MTKLVGTLPVPIVSFVRVEGAITNRFRIIGRDGGGNPASRRPRVDSRRPGQWRKGGKRSGATRIIKVKIEAA